MARNESIREKLEQLKEKGEEKLSQLSEEIRTSAGFVKAVEGARRGQEIVEASLRKAASRLDAPSQEEFRALLSRVEVLERQMTRLTRAASASRERNEAPSSARSRTPASGRKQTAAGGSRKSLAQPVRRKV